jgi:hypothetical protein
MACTLATNLTIGCADETANGGFSKLYLVADADLVSATFGTSPAHTATAITLADSKKFIEFNGRFATKSLASETTKENGGVSITHTLQVFVPKVEKTKGERLSEGLHILKQLREAGVNEFLSYKTLQETITEWINTGEAWSGRISFPEYGRVAELILPKYSKNTASMAFRVVDS